MRMLNLIKTRWGSHVRRERTSADREGERKKEIDMLTLVETITHYLSRIAITVAAALLIYCVAKLWRVSFRVRERAQCASCS